MIYKYVTQKQVSALKQEKWENSLPELFSQKRVRFPWCCIWLAYAWVTTKFFRKSCSAVADFRRCISGCVCDVCAQFTTSSKTFLFCEPAMILSDRNAQWLASLNYFFCSSFHQNENLISLFSSTILLGPESLEYCVHFHLDDLLIWIQNKIFSIFCKYEKK